MCVTLITVGMNRVLTLLQSTVVLVFFITYVICQPPATVLVRKLGPRNFLASITLLWGATMIVSDWHCAIFTQVLIEQKGFGFVKVWTQLLGLRLLLGLFEAGFFPGCVYLLSTWYSRCKQLVFSIRAKAAKLTFGRRSAETLLCVLSHRKPGDCGLWYTGLWFHADERPEWLDWLALDFHYGRHRKIQSNPSTHRTYSKYQLSCLIAIIGGFLLVDFPENAHKSWNFLSEAECAFVIRRVNKDRGDATLEPFTMGRFLRPALDLKIWGFALIFL